MTWYAGLKCSYCFLLLQEPFNEPVPPGTWRHVPHPQHPPTPRQDHGPGGHQVVVVEHLDEGLDLGPLGDLLLAHGGGHFAGVAVDAGDQGVTVGAVSCAVVNVLRTAKLRGHLAAGSRYRADEHLDRVAEATPTLTMTALRPA